MPEVLPITGCIGAEVTGVDLRADLDESTTAVIRQALLDHLVLFFRDQPLSPEQQVAFAVRFGSMRLPMGGSPAPEEGIDPYFDVLEDTAKNPPKANFWHTDVAFLREPPAYRRIRRCVVGSAVPRGPRGPGGRTVGPWEG